MLFGERVAAAAPTTAAKALRKVDMSDGGNGEGRGEGGGRKMVLEGNFFRRAKGAGTRGYAKHFLGSSTFFTGIRYPDESKDCWYSRLWLSFCATG